MNLKVRMNKYIDRQYDLYVYDHDTNKISNLLRMAGQLQGLSVVGMGFPSSDLQHSNQHRTTAGTVGELLLTRGYIHGERIYQVG